MSRQYFSAVRICLSGIISLATIVGSAEVQAKATEPVEAIAKTTSIKFVGPDKNLLIFSIEHANIYNEKFAVEVRGEDDQVLYSHLYTAKNFSRKLYLLKPDESVVVSIYIRSKNTWVRETFEINPVAEYNDGLIVKRD